MSPIPQDLKKMGEKIASLKRKNEKNDKMSPTSGSQLGLAFQVVTEFISGILVGASIGYILDELFDFRVVFLLIFIILGSIAGMVNVYRYLKKTEEKTGD